jgi:hypothetical protein
MVLNDSGIRKEALYLLAQRVLSADRKLGREPPREVEWVHRVGHDLAGEVLEAGVSDRLVGRVPEHRQHQQLAMLSSFREGSGLDARPFVREPLGKLGFAGSREPIMTS